MNLIINPSDIYYLTGVRSHDPGEIMILLKEKEEKGVNFISSRKEKYGIILCDPRTSGLFDAEQYEIMDDRKLWGKTLSQFKTLSADPDFLAQSLRAKIEGYGPRLVMKKSPIIEKRLIKTSGEIELLKQSQLMNKKVYEMILPILVPGVTEEFIARKIQILQLELGATGPSFPPIVAFGSNTAIPHHSPTERKLERDDAVLIDMGLVWKGYCSDMTRMVYQDGIPDEARKIGELVTHVTQEIIQWTKPGMKVTDIDKKARKMLGKYEKYFIHSLGHGVGIDIHEAPHVSGKSREILEPGMIITIEPGIYIAGKYGARYEEMCVVTEKGLLTL